MAYAIWTQNNLDSFVAEAFVDSNTFLSPTDVHIIIIIIIQVFQSCKPIWDFNLILFFDCHIIRFLEIKSLYIYIYAARLLTDNLCFTSKTTR